MTGKSHKVLYINNFVQKLIPVHLMLSHPSAMGKQKRQCSQCSAQESNLWNCYCPLALALTLPLMRMTHIVGLTSVTWLHPTAKSTMTQLDNLHYADQVAAKSMDLKIAARVYYDVATCKNECHENEVSWVNSPHVQ